jgi:hypothetical protein
MANYFNFFPKTVYNLGNPNTLDSITNLTTNFSFSDEMLDNSVIYYQYTISDGETPEIVAHKFYGSAEKHWIVLKMNKIVDVKSEWPMDTESFANVVDAKYANNGISLGQTGYQWAQSHVHSYYMIETRTFTVTGEKTVDTIEIDAQTYANVNLSTASYTLPDNTLLSVSVQKRTKSFYEYETEQNEKNRVIKIMRPDYVATIQEEFVRVMNNV